MKDLICYVKDTFSERKKRNSNYSLRAFAKSLDIPVSTVSEILNKKRPLSKQLRKKLVTKLGLTKEQDKFFVELENLMEQESKIRTSENNYHILEIDKFKVVSSWYHYAILQLLKTLDFKNDDKWMAERLNLTEKEVGLAIQRLIRIGLLSLNKQNQLEDNSDGNTSHLKTSFTNEYMRNFQIEALELGIEAIENVDLDFRDNTTMTFAINKKSMAIAKKEIAKFRRKLTRVLELHSQADEVYQLAISLTPLTNLKGKEG
ncbi:MAG: TIGR02147 family protein [Bdellovibrionaceae bacterium]|mgnify:CR=1 FL=1|jgi:uncharacterized protein (TIGR02147 family)|nr:TIGR02147 family protein [Pseudobdellovibrionaceae bacterium]